MAQIKIYGLEATLEKYRQSLSYAIHESVVEAFQYPPDKRFHRFLPLHRGDFLYPDDKGSDYIILEISIFDGRSIEARKQWLFTLFDKIEQATGITRQAIEIAIFETPRCNWGIRGMPGDELSLDYKVEV